MRRVLVVVSLVLLSLVSLPLAAEDGPIEPLDVKCDEILSITKSKSKKNKFEVISIGYWIAGFVNGYATAADSEKVVRFKRGFANVVKEVCSEDGNMALISATAIASERLFGD